MALNPGSALLTRKVYLVTLKEKIAETLGNVRLVCKIDTSPSRQFLHRNTKKRKDPDSPQRKTSDPYLQGCVDYLKSRVVDPNMDPHLFDLLDPGPGRQKLPTNIEKSKEF